MSEAHGINNLHVHFEPLRTPSTTGRMVVLLAGPLLWLAALVAVAVIAEKTDFILYGLAVAGGSFLLGGALLLFERSRRLREEGERAPDR